MLRKLKNTNNRLLTCSAAIIIAGTLLPGLQASLLGNTGIGVIASIFSNDLPKRIEATLRHSSEILQHSDLIEAVGLAIAVVIDYVAESAEFSQYKDKLHKISQKTGENWWLWAEESGDDIPIEPINESQLLLIFSKTPEEFEKVRLLEKNDWQDIFDWLCVLNNIDISEEIKKQISEKLYMKFPGAIREVLKDDAGRGCQAYKEMQLLLFSKIIDATQDLQRNNKEILERLENTATEKDVEDAFAEIHKAFLVINQSFSEHVAKIETRLDKIASLLKQNQPFDPDFEDYINEKTQDFVGRQFVFDEIKKFLLNQNQGYFIIEGDPGMGKTAIIAKLIRLTKCIGYFNIIRQNRVTTEQFLKNICQQLISRYKLANYSIPIHPDNLRDGTFLSKLLQEASAKLNAQEKLIIAIDALDEVDTSKYRPGVNVLYLPESLPNGVYFVLAKRPQKLRLAVRNIKNFNLLGYKNNCRQDVQSYIRLRISQKQALQNWIQSQQLTIISFVESLANKSDNNFMYLSYILPEIESNRYQDLSINNLPQGLESYYDQHWQRMGMDSRPLPMDKVDILCSLATSREPVSIRFLAGSVNKRPFIVKTVLEDWNQFLHEEKINDQSCYSIYHKSFLDFLRSKMEVYE